MTDKTILFVNSISPQVYGGGEKWCYETAAAFIEKGYRVALVARPDSRIMEKFQELDCDMYPLVFGPDYNPVSIIRLYRYFKKINAGYLILSFNKDVTTAGVAGRLSGVKKIVFRNGYSLINKKSRHRMMMPLYDTLVCNSMEIAEHYRSFGWGLERKTSVVYNGAQIREKLPVVDRKPLVILGAGRLVHVKRYHIFLDILAMLNSHVPVKGILLGDGPEKSRLEQQAREIGAPVEFAGHVPSIEPFLQKCDLFLHTSRNEGIPNVVMEAMSAGIPVIATNAGGTGELLTDNENGFLCAIDDVDSLFQKSLQLLTNIELRRTFSQAGWNTIASKFNIQKSVEQIEQLLIK